VYGPHDDSSSGIHRGGVDRRPARSLSRDLVRVLQSLRVDELEAALSGWVRGGRRSLPCLADNLFSVIAKEALEECHRKGRETGKCRGFSLPPGRTSSSATVQTPAQVLADRLAFLTSSCLDCGAFGRQSAEWAKTRNCPPFDRQSIAPP
jgi:hypothetical protein